MPAPCGSVRGGAFAITPSASEILDQLERGGISARDAIACLGDERKMNDESCRILEMRAEGNITADGVGSLRANQHDYAIPSRRPKHPLFPEPCARMASPLLPKADAALDSSLSKGRVVAAQHELPSPTQINVVTDFLNDLKSSPAAD